MKRSIKTWILPLVLVLVSAVAIAGVQSVEVGGFQIFKGIKFDGTGSQLTCVRTDASCRFTSNTADGTTTASVGSWTFALGADITATDLGWRFADSADATVAGLTEAGIFTTSRLIASNTSADTTAMQISGGTRLQLNGATADRYIQWQPGAARSDFNTGATYFFDGNVTYYNIVSLGAIAQAASGSNGLAIATNGARIDHGAGANDYSSSDGTTVTYAGPLASASTLTAAGITDSANLTFSGATSVMSSSDTGNPVTVDDAEGFGIVGVAFASLAACNTTAPPAGTRGTFQYDTTNSQMLYCNGTSWVPTGGTATVAQQQSITGGGPSTIGTQRTKARQITCGLSTASAFYDLQAGAICGTQASLGTRASATISGSTVAMTTPFFSNGAGVSSYLTTTAVGVLWQTAPEFEGWFRLDDTSNVAFKIQFSSTSASTNCTTNLNATNQDEATFKVDTSANANFQYCTGDGANVTCADAIAVDTAWHYFKIVLVPDATIANLASVQFTLDSTTYSSVATLPNLNTTTVLLPTICLDQTDDTGAANLFTNGWVYRSY